MVKAEVRSWGRNNCCSGQEAYRARVGFRAPLSSTEDKLISREFFSSPVWGFSLPSTDHITSTWEYRKGRMHLGDAEDHRPDIHHCRMLPSFFGFWKFLCSRLASTGGHIHCRVSESLSF